MKVRTLVQMLSRMSRIKFLWERGGGQGGGWGRGRCLKWGGGEWRVIKESFQKHLKIEVGKGKIVCKGSLRCHHPCLP